MAFRTSRFPAVLAILTVACTGPALQIDNPGGHTLFLDGAAAKTGSMPFRYYGTTRWDALPADRAGRLGRPDWQHLPTSQMVAVPAPASEWLFPLDFPLELLARLMHGRGDQTTLVEVQPAPPALRTETEIANLELAAQAQRAREARASR